MPKIPADTKTGFWIGLGLLAAFAAWALISMLVSKGAAAAEGSHGH